MVTRNRLNRANLTTACEVVGAGLVAIGAGLLAVPLGLIAGGALLIAFGWFAA